MVNPNSNSFMPIDSVLQKEFTAIDEHGDKAEVSQHVREQHKWARFTEDEIIRIKGVSFRVHEIGEKRIILKVVSA
jgi:hypothetical protein